MVRPNAHVTTIRNSTPAVSRRMRSCSGFIERRDATCAPL
jgi:hypothetical protein